MAAVNVRCNLCNSDNYKVIYNSTIDSNNISPMVTDYISTVNKYSIFNNIVRCKCCGLTYMNPRDADVRRFYREVIDNAYIESCEQRIDLFKSHLRLLRKYTNGKGNLLDLGCYAGIFAGEAKREGYNVVGIEPSKWAVEFARKNIGVSGILEGSWDEVSLEQNSFDVITMLDVIEHIEDPSSCLKQIYNWLRKDGIVAITTHDIGSLFARLLREKYPWLMRFHLYHFEPKTLSTMLYKNNLEPITVKYYTKTFSLNYFLSHVGIKIPWKSFKKIKISLNTGDMFLIIARKNEIQNNIN